jgi:SRSO17 transposase
MRRRGHALIDRELYLPRSWTEDRDRCRAAGIPDETGFATKPRLAQVILSRAITAGVPFAWHLPDSSVGHSLLSHHAKADASARRSDGYLSWLTRADRRIEA